MPTQKQLYRTQTRLNNPFPGVTLETWKKPGMFDTYLDFFSAFTIIGSIFYFGAHFLVWVLS